MVTRGVDASGRTAREAETPDLLEWFRLDRADGTRWLLGIGGVCVFVGCAALGGAFLARGPASGPVAELLRATPVFGAGLLLFGLFVAFGGMALLLANDDYLAVREDGILLHRSSGDVVVAWEDLRRIHAEDGALVLGGDETEVRVVERYAGATRVQLAAHLEALRRKASLERLTENVVKRIAIGLPHVRPGSVRSSS